MPKIEQKNPERGWDEEYDYQEASYVLPPQGPSAGIWLSHPEGDEKLGEMRQPEVYETEHHVYSAPFRFENVQLRYWSENSASPANIRIDRTYGFVFIYHPPKCARAHNLHENGMSKPA